MDQIRNNSREIIPYVGQSNTPVHKPEPKQESLEIRIYRIGCNSLQIQFQDHHYFQQYGMGDIVVLVGSSTAGKTSIIKALLQLEPNRHEDGIDLKFASLFVNNIRNYCANEISTLENAMKRTTGISSAIFSPERGWKEGITSQEKEKAEQAIATIKKDGFFF